MLGWRHGHRRLYDRDFYVWTQEQAAALRAAGKAGGKSNAVEWERVAEEVEDLGKRERREVMLACTFVVEALFKSAWSKSKPLKAQCHETIIRQQCDLRDRVTASLRGLLVAEWEALHKRALRLANSRMDADEPDAPRDQTLRWALEDVLGY